MQTPTTRSFSPDLLTKTNNESNLTKMKREGCHHGTVRINRNKQLRVVAAAATAEETTVVGAIPPEKAPTTKPGKGSRTTSGKCRRPRCAGCQYHPVTNKAKDKSKGAHKLHACDVALNHRLVSWRVVDVGGSGSSSGIPDYKGTSASSLLAYLAGGSGSSWHEDDDDGGSLDETAPPVDGGLSDLYDLIVGRRADVAVLGGQDAADHTDIAVGDTDAIEEQEHGADDVEEDGDEEDMGFCMVGITIAVEFSDGEEDWVVVQEI